MNDLFDLTGKVALVTGGGYSGAAYCASTGAVDTLTRTLACQWAKYNVLVNAIAPFWSRMA